MRYPDFLNSVRGCYLGVGVGDALGVPVETMSHEAIMAATGGAGITGYVEPMQTRVRDTKGLPKGSTSDDTQLTLVTNHSLVQRRGFDIVDQGLCLVAEHERSTFGWGGTTTQAAIDIKRWRDSEGKEGRHPECPAPPPTPEFPGIGSGVAMRIAPLAVYALFGRGDSDKAAMMFLSHAMDLGLMTHGDPRASFAAVALGHAIAAFAEASVNPPRARLRDTLPARIVAQVKDAERMYRHFRKNEDTLSGRLENAFALLDDPVTLRTKVNASFAAIDSVPFAIATALRHEHDFAAAVLEGVNAGKDTDTVGSMVGAMLGARVSEYGIPPQWQNGLRDFDALLKEADDISMVCFNLDPDDAKRVLSPDDRDKAH